MPPFTHMLCTVLVPLDEFEEYQRNLPHGNYLYVADKIVAGDLEDREASRLIGTSIAYAFGRALKDKAYQTEVFKKG